MTRRRVPREPPASTLFCRGRETRCGMPEAPQSWRAGCAEFSLTPFAASLQSIRSPPVRALSVQGRIRGGPSTGGERRPSGGAVVGSSAAPAPAPRFANYRLLTKVREWTRASSPKFAASTVSSPAASARSKPITCAGAGRWRRRGSFSKSGPTASTSGRCGPDLGSIRAISAVSSNRSRRRA